MFYFGLFSLKEKKELEDQDDLGSPELTHKKLVNCFQSQFSGGFGNASLLRSSPP